MEHEVKNSGRIGPHQRLSYGSKDPSQKPGNGINWDKLKRQNEERLDREWEEGVRRNDTIRRRWMKTLSSSRLKQEEQLLLKGKRTPLAIGEDGEPYATGEPQELPKSRPSRAGQHQSKTGRPKGTPYFDVEEIVKLYVEEGLSPQQISNKYGGKPSYPTVVKYLKDRKVFDRDRHRSGGSRDRRSYEKQRQTKCANGHDLTNPDNVLERVRKLPDGTTRPNGRECRICNRERHKKVYRDMRNKINGQSS